MNKRTGLIIALTAFFAATLAAQNPSPAPSPETSPITAKHKLSKKKVASPAATAAAASPSPAKQKRSKKTEATTTPAVSPVAASPSPGKRPWYRRMAASPTPATSPTAGTSTRTRTTGPVEPTGTIAPGGGPGMVWVNTATHVYHKQGSRWYGTTKQGKYVSEQDARNEGDRAGKEEIKEQ
jgi:hypothetical protein